MIPKVFGDLLPRFHHTENNYTAVYRLPPRKFDSAEMGVVEFKGNKLPQLLSNEQKFEQISDCSQDNNVIKWKTENIPLRGTPV